MNIIKNPNMVITYQYRFCRSKKKRILKKWKKNPANYKIKPDKNCLVSGNFITCHPAMAEEIKNKIKNYIWETAMKPNYLHPFV